MPDEADEQIVQVPVAWVGVDEAPITLVNQFLGQFQQDEFILTFGQFAPPALLGTPEERLEEARSISFVSIKVLARFGLTRARVEELIGVLEQTLKNYDETQTKGGEADAGSRPE